MSFSNTRFGWLTNELPPTAQFKSYIQAVLGEGLALSVHGDIQVEEARDPHTNLTIDEGLHEKNLPAFLIREYTQSGGLFIYACFKIDALKDFKQIFKNIMLFRSNSSSVQLSVAVHYVAFTVPEGIIVFCGLF